eukprot:jgi/Mesvir1/2907/Mv13978-RA.1
MHRGEGHYELATVPYNGQRCEVLDPPRKTVFDTREELAWVGTQEGWLQSVMIPSLARYTGFKAHILPVEGLCTFANGLVSVSADTIAIHARTGLQLHAHIEPAGDFTALEWQTMDYMSSSVAVGHLGPSLSSFDLVTQQLHAVNSEVENVTVMRRGGHYLACGSSSGKVTLHDPRSLRRESSLDAHMGPVAALDVKGDLLVTSGIIQHMGISYVDHLIKVFDIRSVARALTHLPFSPGPMMLRFLPKFSSMLLVASATGSVMLEDVQSPGANFKTFQVDCEGDAMLCCDVSSSGESIGFADEGGFFHLWAATNEPRANLISVPSEMPEMVPCVSLAEGDPFTGANLPSVLLSMELPLSAYEPTSLYHVGQPPRTIPADLAGKIKTIDFVGYVDNPFFSRTAPPGEATRKSWQLRNSRIRSAATKDGGKGGGRGGGPPSRRSSMGEQEGDGPHGADGRGKRIPKLYRHVEIQSSITSFKFEEFDFSYYNKTRFAGLENDIPLCYCNSLMQILFFIPALREAVLSHICEREFCLTCELGFLMHMLTISRAGTCQASNILRALAQIREAAALGLLDDASDQYGLGDEKRLARRIQSFSRFLLEQLHKEATTTPGAGSTEVSPLRPQSQAKAAVAAQGVSSRSKESLADRLFGASVKSVIQCPKKPDGDIVRLTRSFQFDLQYNFRKELPSPPPSFAKVLERSLRREEDIRAWCDHCQGYHTVKQTRVVTSLPSILSINCCISDATEMQAWTDPTPAARGKAGMATDQAGTLPGASASELRGSDDGAAERAHFLPFVVTVELQPERNEVSVTEHDSLASPGHEPSAGASGAGPPPPDGGTPKSPGAGPSRAMYMLTSLLAYINEEDESRDGALGHLVSLVNVPPIYAVSARKGGIAPNTPAPGHPPTPGNPYTPVPAAAPASSAPRVSSVAAAANAASAAVSAAAGTSAGAEPEREAEGTEASSAPGSHPFSSSSSSSGGPSSSSSTAGAASSDAGMFTPLKAPRRSRSSEEFGSASKGGGATPAPPGSDSSSTLPSWQWVLFNDFTVAPVPASEVVNFHGGLKVPCLLHYTRVDVAQSYSQLVVHGMGDVDSCHDTPAHSGSSAIGTPAGAGHADASTPAGRSSELVAASPPTPPRPARSSPIPDELFWRYVADPGLSQSQRFRANKPTFVPFKWGLDTIGPDTLLGIDAEFVALTPPRTHITEEGERVTTRPSRLGLARVSVVRGSGPQKLVCVIDDYVSSVEPVYDYLTRFSGLEHGDLDPAVSKHHITTLKKAYIKLRFLVDHGCKFVGHGLKKDFNMINVVVPPEQVVDTVELFRLKRQRKISLRFLAAYLLGLDIQSETHDSIEDARTALKLYYLHEELAAKGTLQDKLLEMYRFGRIHNWEVSAVKEAGAVVSKPRN